MEDMFENESFDSMSTYCLPYEQFSDYESFDALSDELASPLEQSFPSSSIPNTPGSSEASATESLCAAELPQQITEPQPVIFPAYAATQQQVQPASVAKTEPVVKTEPVDNAEPAVKAEPVVRPAPAMTHQPAAKRGRSAAAPKQQKQQKQQKQEKQEKQEKQPEKQEKQEKQSSTFALSEAKLRDLLNTDNMDSYMQSLSKGNSEDIELFRNVLRCHGSLTPDAEKQLRHVARQVKNRESAQLSRQRKREYVKTLKSVIDKMRSVDETLRTDFNTVQTELAQCKTETEQWQNYAHNLQKLLMEHGIEVPKEPEFSGKPIDVQSYVVPQVSLPETLFSGPCGFGHMTTPKSNGNGKRRSRAEKVNEVKA